jgi:ribosomal protein S18 acetylase RimI-like enzyme
MLSNQIIRTASLADTNAIGEILHAFNIEYGEPTPVPSKLSDRFKMLLVNNDTVVLLAGDRPSGIAVLRFRPSLWSDALECYLAELYVVPDLRGNGIGRALLCEALKIAKDRGADSIDLGTSEADIAARKLYESVGFSNRETRPDGPIMFVYERAL